MTNSNARLKKIYWKTPSSIMFSFIKFINIRNFKSIRQISIEPCARINLFIGRANGGKSNILEALALFSLPFLKENTSKKITHFVRLENLPELFYEGNTIDPISIDTNISTCLIHYNLNQLLDIEINDPRGVIRFHIDNRLNFRSGKSKLPIPYIKKYRFLSEAPFENSHTDYLIPPYGSNLSNIIDQDKQLKQELADMLKIGEHFAIPYSSISDTFRRILFFKAAIRSNQQSIFLFEEPDANIFPPYISHITQEMLLRKEHQFFITAHSSFILNDLLKNAREEIAIFNTDYKDHQTIIRRLSEEELSEIYEHGVDLFTNNESYM